MNSGRKNSGFTLIELIVVAAIIVLVILFATARLDFLLPKYELRTAAREIGGAMKMAKNKATVSGRDVYIQYNLSEGTYHLLVLKTPQVENPEEETPEDPTTTRAMAPSKPPEEEKQAVYEETFEHTLPEGVEFVDVIQGKALTTKSGRALVRMTPFGFSEHHIVNLRNAGGDVIAVKLNGFTGGLTYYDEHKDPDEILED